MRNLLTAVALAAAAHAASAATYFVSAVHGDDARTPAQAQSASTPWKTLARLNAYNTSLKPGDLVLFNRGESYQGTLEVRSSGLSGQPIVYGAYGVGSNPVISGFTTVGNWRPEGNGVYSAPLEATNLNIVTINGEAKAMGRYPNTGYLNYETATASSITDTQLAASPSWTGAEVVMRKYRFIIDRQPVTQHAGTTLTLGTSSENGNNAAYKPVARNGYFVQKHRATLDLAGEWYHDEAAKRLYVFFGSSSPASFVVNAATRSMNASVAMASFVRFENLSFEGANARGMSLTNVANIQLQNTSFSNQGGSAVYGAHTNAVAISGGTIANSFSNGINFEEDANNTTVDGVAVTGTNLMAGTARSGSGASMGITVNGNNTRIVNNRVVGAGYSGIQFLGNNVLVERNYVDTACTLKDDGGGIYTFNGAANVTNYNRKIRNNVIMNAVGAYAGAEAYPYEAHGKCAGIYLDEFVNGVEISGNTIANGDWAGIFLHNAHTNVITNNTIYNHRYAVHVSQYTAATRNTTLTGNQYIARQPHQKAFYYRTFVADSPATMGTSNNNWYARPIADTDVVHIDSFYTGGAGTAHLSLAQWTSAYGLDSLSQKSPVTYAGDIDVNLRFEVNGTNAPRAVSLNATYRDVHGATFSGTTTLNPYSSLVLFKTGALATTPTGGDTPPPPPTGGVSSQTVTFPSLGYKTWGAAPFTLAATSSSGLPVSYKVVSGPATVSGNTVTITDVGSVFIEAQQAGNAAYSPATPVTRGFTVGKAGQSLTFNSPGTKTFGSAPFALSASASSGLPPVFTYVSGPATLSGNVVTLTGRGTVTLTIAQPGDSRFAAAYTLTRSFTVQ